MTHEKSKHLLYLTDALKLAHNMNMYICDEIYDLKNYKIETILIADILTIKVYLDRCWKLKVFL